MLNKNGAANTLNIFNALPMGTSKNLNIEITKK